MSNETSLSELARFTSQSALATDDPEVRRAALGALARQIDPRLKRRTVTDMLGTVLALSARTRRMVLTPVNVDIDVFAPGGKRAVRMQVGF